MKKIIALILAALTFVTVFAACGKDETDGKTETTKAAASQEANEAEEFVFPDGITILGNDESKYSFIFKAVHKDGRETEFGIRTDKETIGEALVECGLLEGREESSGYVVYTIDGVKHDHNTEGFYWVLYINGELAEVDVMQTAIEDGATYEFICERYMK